MEDDFYELQRQLDERGYKIKKGGAFNPRRKNEAQ